MKIDGMLSVSMMCSNLHNLNQEIKIFENEHIEYLHIDVMDGEFVSNLGLGTDYIRGIRKMTDIPLDLHLMIKRPEEKFDWFDIQRQDIVSIHYESTNDLNRALEWAHKYSDHVFLAINPGTPICLSEEVLEYIDGIHLLTVNPGFAGQPIVKSCINKVKRLRSYLDNTGFSDIIIEADGNINIQNAAALKRNGAGIFVAGSSSIYKTEYLVENIRELRKSLE